MEAYLSLARRILEHGTQRGNRTGIDALSIFGHQSRYDLRAGFPLLTTKRLHWKSIVYELLWFLRGDTNVHSLQAKGVRIWNEWAREDGSLGPIYGAQWRSWPAADGRHIDQLAGVIEEIRHHPESRRLLVSSWNVGALEEMALPPCHVLFQFYVADGRLSCQLYQRSADVFLGVPFNIASYALLTHLVAHSTGLEVGEFIHSIGDAHIYTNHLDGIREQLRREPRPLPTLHLSGGARAVWDYNFEDIHLQDYDPHPHIAGVVAV